MTHHEDDQLTRFATPDPALAIGTTHQGFTVTAIEALPELSGTAYLMRHDATGARLMWLATADTNRSFAIAFKTPPADDTGVFHILEHSVLCGSERFPVKEPFVHLLKSSMQTFLNALTFPDKTMYPVSSTNVTDLENLMDVYLDAVLHPAIYQRPRIFEQEGWHLECEGPDAPLTYNGVVFNEMKGALSDPDDVAYMNLQRLLFPDTAYRYESGGNPRAIPQLTYERFIDTHARHYNLPNSYTILYGDLDIERELAFVGTRFDAAAPRNAGTPNELGLQAPVVAPYTRVEMATAPENALVALGYVVGTSSQRERMLATDILLDALMGSNEAPLKRAVLDAGLGDDVQASFVDGVLQPQVVLMLKGAKPGVAEQFAGLVEQVCTRLAHEGIERSRLTAALAQAEFTLRENDFGGSYSDGVAYSMQALSSWLYDDARPVDYLRYEQELAHLHEGLDNGLFERLLTEVVCESAHHALLELVPVEQGDAAEEVEELAARKEQMTPEQLSAIMDEVTALREEQERPDAPEDIAKLPHLALSDIGEASHETPVRHEDAPLPCLAHDLDTHHILYAYHYFDLLRLTYDDLPYAALLTDLLSRLATERLSAAELDTVLEEGLGNLSFFFDIYGRDDDPSYVHPYMAVGASALSEKVRELATLPSEVWGTTRFDDLDQIHDIVQQRRLALEQRFLGAGHACATARLGCSWSRASLVRDMVSGIGYYRFVKDLLANWDERAPLLPARLAELARHIFTADEVLVSLTGSADDRTRFWEEGGTLGLASAGADTCAHRLDVPEPVAVHEAFVIPANVCFVAEGQPVPAPHTGAHGTWMVASRALSLDYLWNEVRVKGGAYGCGFRRNTTGTILYYSFRDPGVDATVARYERASEWLAAWDPSDDDLAGYLISIVASHDAPLKARQLARRQDSLILSERPEGWRDRVRAEVLEANREKVRALAPTLATLHDQRTICVFGGRELIEASELPLEVIDLMA